MSKQKITFESEGSKVVGNLFRPQKAEKTSLPAVLVTGAMTGVKEQVAGSYAERIAIAGFVTLVFDHKHLIKIPLLNKVSSETYTIILYRVTLRELH